jgi:phenylalanyl-tRNA synthetase beta chain
VKFSCNWLADFVDLPADKDELARAATACGHAVEGVEAQGDDIVLDVDVTSNRPDAMNHFGLARDLAVKLGVALRGPAIPALVPDSASATFPSAFPPAFPITVELTDPAACPRYAAQIIRGVRIGPSPAWLRTRLEAIGQRSINNVVDVTNYVMWELGQPLHAFDLATLRGERIVVRRARAGEVLTTLDGQKRTLDPEILVIADAERTIALGGVMGGLDTEVTAQTCDILLEGAHFAKAVIRRGAKRLGMHTDASHRFERGADPLACAAAVRRGAALIAEVAGGTVAAGAVDARADELYAVDGRLTAKRPIRLERERLCRLLGLDVPAAEVERILVGLGCKLSAEGSDAWQVEVPSWRWYDMELPADLYEEVLRFVGCDAVPVTLPRLAGPDAPASPEVELGRRLRDVLAACGFAEAINYGFESPEAARSVATLGTGETFLTLTNPLSDRYSTLRRSLLPGLVESAGFNLRRGAEAVRLFELGHVFHDEEFETLAVVQGGRLGTPWQRAFDLDLYDLKGVLETLAEDRGVGLDLVAADLVGFQGGRSGEIRLAGERIGTFGELAIGDAPFPLFACELRTDRLLAAAAVRVRVQPASRFPGIAVDLTLTHALATGWHELATAIEAARAPLLVRFGLKDRYRGKGVPAGAVNTTIGFYYNADERSLTQDEVNDWHRALTAALQERFGWQEPAVPGGKAD